MSAYTVRAIVIAYKALNLGTIACVNEAAFHLQNYLVILYQMGSSIEVEVGNPDTRDIRRIYVDGKTGAILSKPEGTYRSVLVLPGFIAGEVVATYTYALSDKLIPTESSALLRQGTFNLSIFPSFTGSIFDFFALDQVPAGVVLGEIPTASSSRSGNFECVAGACYGDFASYRVYAFHGNVEIGYSVVSPRSSQKKSTPDQRESGC